MQKLLWKFNFVTRKNLKDFVNPTRITRNFLRREKFLLFLKKNVWKSYFASFIWVKLIHFQMWSIYLPINDLPWYLSKWQFANLGVLAWFRNLKLPTLRSLIPYSWRFQDVALGPYQEAHSTTWTPAVLGAPFTHCVSDDAYIFPFIGSSSKHADRHPGLQLFFWNIALTS